MKAGGGSKIIEKNRSRRTIKKSEERRRVEYSIISYEVVAAFIIIFGMCKKKGI
jgi:hypothetical protein